MQGVIWWMRVRRKKNIASDPRHDPISRVLIKGSRIQEFKRIQAGLLVHPLGYQIVFLTDLVRELHSFIAYTLQHQPTIDLVVLPCSLCLI